MRPYIALLILLIPSSVCAQNYGGMDKGKMQSMMQTMQQVQKCMAGIDQTRLNELKDSSEQIKQKIDTLCAQGKRDQARKEAMAFGRKIGSDPAMQQMRKCGEIAQGALPMADMPDFYDEKNDNNRHVCDN